MRFEPKNRNPASLPALRIEIGDSTGVQVLDPKSLMLEMYLQSVYRDRPTTSVKQRVYFLQQRG